MKKHLRSMLTMLCMVALGGGGVLMHKQLQRLMTLKSSLQITRSSLMITHQMER